MKLMLGGVQFGLDYGLSNSGGKTSANEVKEILDLAKMNDINYIDTAALYGSSEEVLGETVNGRDFKIVTKTEGLTGLRYTPDIESIFLSSLKKTKQKKLYGLLFHDAGALSESYGHLIYSQAVKLKSQGLVKKIGVSVYSPQQIEFLLENYDLDLIQVPLNVLDQRIYRDGLLDKLKNRNIEVHARSAFLQGLLLMPVEQVHPYFSPISPLLQQWQQDLSELKISPLSGALGFLKNINHIDKIVIGVNSAEQLREIIDVYRQEVAMDYSKYAIEDTRFIHPTEWQVG